MLAFSIAGRYAGLLICWPLCWPSVRYAGLLSALARSSFLPVSTSIVASANFADSAKRARTWRHQGSIIADKLMLAAHQPTPHNIMAVGEQP